MYLYVLMQYYLVFLLQNKHISGSFHTFPLMSYEYLCFSPQPTLTISNCHHQGTKRECTWDGYHEDHHLWHCDISICWYFWWNVHFKNQNNDHDWWHFDRCHGHFRIIFGGKKHRIIHILSDDWETQFVAPYRSLHSPLDSKNHGPCSPRCRWRMYNSRAERSSATFFLYFLLGWCLFQTYWRNLIFFLYM